MEISSQPQPESESAVDMFNKFSKIMGTDSPPEEISSTRKQETSVDDSDFYIKKLMESANERYVFLNLTLETYKAHIDAVTTEIGGESITRDEFENRLEKRLRLFNIKADPGLETLLLSVNFDYPKLKLTMDEYVKIVDAAYDKYEHVDRKLIAVEIERVIGELDKDRQRFGGFR